LPKCILLADDFEQWRRWVRSALTLNNHFQIHEAMDGFEAVQKAGELGPDLILLDVGLPHLNGIEVARQIRQAGIATAILFLTVNDDAEVRNAAIAAGASGYLSKMHAARDLIPAVEAALAGG
jgi:DNA-binding NarL/FixJ family response regulator